MNGPFHIYLDTCLKYVSPLCICDGCPQGLLKEKACLSFWEVPNHLGHEELTAQLCNDIKGCEPLRHFNVIQLHRDTHSQ